MSVYTNISFLYCSGVNMGLLKYMNTVNIVVRSMFIKEEHTILLIEGIDLNKVNSSLHSNSEVVEYDPPDPQYDKLKKQFTDYATWEPNNLVCWNCTLNFTNKPVFIPLTIQKTHFEIHCIFCSFGCATRHVNIHFKYDNKKRCQNINNLRFLYHTIYNEDIGIIREAPEKETIDKFGGELTPEQYKKL
jgi:hypothetical protein